VQGSKKTFAVSNVIKITEIYLYTGAERTKSEGPNELSDCMAIADAGLLTVLSQVTRDGH